MDDLRTYQEIERQIALKLGLEDFHSGCQVIRNEKGWRDNEKQLAYAWIVHIDRFLVGFGGAFAVKFNANTFREQHNPTELVQGIFRNNKEGLTDFYVQVSNNLVDKIVAIEKFNLFKANSGITLDGIGYRFTIYAGGIHSTIVLNNPKEGGWDSWETELFAIGRELAEQSGCEALVALFR